MAFGIVLPQMIVLTDGKSSFSNIVGTLKRGDIVEIVEDLADGWFKVTDQKTGITGNTPISNLTVNEEQPATTTTVESPYTILVNTTGVSLRAGAGVQFPVVATVAQGTSLTVKGQEGDWLKVDFSGKDAYVAALLTQRQDTVKDSSAFLSDQPDLMSVELLPTMRIPTDGLTEKTRPFVAARVWNTYGGLLQKLADKLQIPVASTVAVIGAESGGKAFGDDGQLIIRFEVHIFKKFWGNANQTLFDRYFQSDGFKSHKFRASESVEWGAVHTSQKREWEVLTFARSLDDTAALKSISMGAPQIMGFNYKALGYESVQAMFETFNGSAHAQILGLFDFVRGGSSVSQAIRALQTGDFLTFASIYNGTGNAPTYEAIIEDYVSIFTQLFAKAQPVTLPDTQRGPADTSPAITTATPTEVSQAQNPPAAEMTVTQTQSVAVTPASSDTILVPTMQLNVREAANTSAKAIGTVDKGAELKLLESLDAALAKIQQPESAHQFLEIDFNGQKAYVAAWLTIPTKKFSQANVFAYIDSLPVNELPSAYYAFRAQQDRLGLPDPFDILPIQISSENQMVNMQVNGFGPNTFSMWNGAKWYSRIGYMHNGYDFICKTGTPLIAVADGVIIKNWVFMANPAEKTVVLWPFLPEKYVDSKGRRMMSNVLIAMGHLSNGSVRKNHEVVKKGDIIGYTGTPAGSNTNDHLHYEIHLINGEPGLPNPRTNKMLTEYKGDQNAGNNTPWNALMFYSPRIVNYSLHQGKTIGFLGKYPEYPTADMLKQNNSQHLDPLGPLALSYYRYGIANVWSPRTDGNRFPFGVVTSDKLEEKLPSIPDWKPVEATFLD